MRVLHISADFPDPLKPGKTKAIANLLELTRGDLEHRVYSLNRVDRRHGIHALDFAGGAGEGGGETWRAVAYGAPPKGIMLRRYLDRVADFVLEDVARRGVTPDAVHAHKLSVEGLVADRVAHALDVPLAISCQGNSDLKIVGAKRSLRPVWRRIWQQADLVFPFAPWTEAGLTDLLGARGKPTHPLPCPTPQDRAIRPATMGPLVRTAFNFADHANKNVARLIDATGRARRSVPDLRLEIFGGGDPQAFAGLAERAATLPDGAVTLAGPRPHDAMQELFHKAAAFALPSKRESYGMVFAEALLAGTPVLHSRDTAIDGYLEPGLASLAVDPDDTDEIAAALVRLTREEERFKAQLARLHDDGRLNRFMRTAIAATYRDALQGLARDPVSQRQVS